MPTQYGMDGPQLKGITDATSATANEMWALNVSVNQNAQDYIRANNSDSGRVIQGQLDEWNADFAKVAGDLDQLNHKVEQLGMNNLTVNNDAKVRAQGSGLR